MAYWRCECGESLCYDAASPIGRRSCCVRCRRVYEFQELAGSLVRVTERSTGGDRIFDKAEAAGRNSKQRRSAPPSVVKTKRTPPGKRSAVFAAVLLLGVVALSAFKSGSSGPFLLKSDYGNVIDPFDGNQEVHVFRCASWCPESRRLIEEYLLPIAQGIGYGAELPQIVLVFDDDEFAAAFEEGSERASLLKAAARAYDPDLGERFCEPMWVARNVIGSPLTVCSFKEESYKSWVVKNRIPYPIYFDPESMTWADQEKMKKVLTKLANRYAPELVSRAVPSESAGRPEATAADEFERGDAFHRRSVATWMPSWSRAISERLRSRSTTDRLMSQDRFGAARWSTSAAARIASS